MLHLCVLHVSLISFSVFVCVRVFPLHILSIYILHIIIIIHVQTTLGHYLSCLCVHVHVCIDWIMHCGWVHACVCVCVCVCVRALFSGKSIF